MFRAQGPILGHIPSGLAHKPHRGTINGLSTACFQKSIIHGGGILVTRDESCQTAIEGLPLLLSATSATGTADNTREERDNLHGSGKKPVLLSSDSLYNEAPT
jgi:hypothetical protein